MDPALKQRLVGAIVLVALAVIFLPMLIQGPAPESGAADVSLDVPARPGEDFETREIPLVAPRAAPAGGALGLDPGTGTGQFPTVDTADGDGTGEGPGIADDGDPGMAEPPGSDGMFPPPTAGGNYVVNFGSFSSAGAADRLVADLRASQLPGYRERGMSDGWAVHRVRIGPYASRAEAEAARLRAAHVRDDVGARVVALDGTTDDAPAPRDEPVASPPPEPRDEPDAEPEPVRTPPPPAAAAGTGFAVQLGAFSDAADAARLRDRVRAGGFTAFTEQVQTAQGQLTRVLVGPVLDRAAAERLQAQVAAEFGIEGLVRSHP